MRLALRAVSSRYCCLGIDIFFIKVHLVVIRAPRFRALGSNTASSVKGIAKRFRRNATLLCCRARTIVVIWALMCHPDECVVFCIKPATGRR